MGPVGGSRRCCPEGRWSINGNSKGVVGECGGVVSLIILSIIEPGGTSVWRGGGSAGGGGFRVRLNGRVGTGGRQGRRSGSRRRVVIKKRDGGGAGWAGRCAPGECGW